MDQVWKFLSSTADVLEPYIKIAVLSVLVVVVCLLLSPAIAIGGLVFVGLATVLIKAMK